MVIDDTAKAVMYNTAFVAKVASSEGLEKMAGMATDFCRAKIREGSFTRKILPPKQITSADLDQAVDSDSPMRIIHKDKVSEAYPVTFREQAQQRYYIGDKFQVFYANIQSEEFHKVTEELQTYRVPIKQIVQENYLKDIQRAEDKQFIDTVNAILKKKESEKIGTSVYATSEDRFTPATLAEGLKLLVAKELPIGTILINEQDWMSLYQLQQDAAGSAVMQEIIHDGYSYTKLLGRDFVRTIKNDIVPPGRIYIFSTPEYLGVFDILEDVKAFMETRANKFSFHLWETIGIAIGNDNGVAMIQLASANPLIPASTVAVKTAPTSTVKGIFTVKLGTGVEVSKVMVDGASVAFVASGDDVTVDVLQAAGVHNYEFAGANGDSITVECVVE